MRVILLLLLAGGAIVLVSQNWSPVLPLVLFGRETLVLPVALWLSLGVLAGGLTSLAWQLLSSQPRPRSPAAAPDSLEAASQPWWPREIRRQRDRNWESRPGADWETPPPPPEDWNIEEPPTEPTPLRSPQVAPQAPSPVQDRPPRPVTPIASPPETAGEAETGYDANYRVLTTPPPEGAPSETLRDRPEEADDAPDWV